MKPGCLKQITAQYHQDNTGRPVTNLQSLYIYSNDHNEKQII